MQLLNKIVINTIRVQESVKNLTQIDNVKSLAVAGEESAFGGRLVRDNRLELNSSHHLSRLDVDEQDVRLARFRQL